MNTFTYSSDKGVTAHSLGWSFDEAVFIIRSLGYVAFDATMTAHRSLHDTLKFLSEQSTDQQQG
ncbi:MAG: hypothetical protein L0287_35010 [Anaerolineae bacterium]|nr:hypothetical protein [Anaerolineae bacterium]